MNCIFGMPAAQPAYAGRSGIISLLAIFVGVTSCWGQSSLAVIDDVDVRALRFQCRELLEGLAKVKAALPPETERGLRDLLKDEKKPSDESAAKIQRLLNAQCLVAVSINPESRVKAARGPRSAELFVGKESVVLVRVLNEAGVTHALSLEGPQIIGPKENAKDRWLHATVYPELPSSQKLSGQKVEYVLLRLKPEKAGKREATLIFDVGQGTQDLGFRAEVPILFTIKEE
jgi:hypothetical protein